MRDVDRLKEKWRFSLDIRQVTSIVIGALVVLGAVFGLGVTIGRKLGAPPPADVAAGGDVLARVDARSADAIDPARDLTYPETLTRPADDLHAAPPADDPEAAAEAPAPSPSDPAPAVESPAPVEPATPRRAEPAPRVAAASGRARLEPAPRGGEFTVQVAATPTRSEAEGFADRLRSRGYRPYVVDAQVPGKGRWFRVRVGAFESKAEAERYLMDFRRETRLEAFVTSVR